MDVPEKGGDVSITLTAAPAAPRSSQPFSLTLRDAESSKQYPVLFKIVSTSEDNGVPQGYRKLLISSTDQLWLTLTPQPPLPPAPPADSVAK